MREEIDFRGASYGELVLRAVSARPNAVAFVRGDSRITYAEVGARISQFVQVYRSLNLGVGDSIAFLSLNNPDYFMSMIAAALLGIRYTPLHPLGSFEDHSFILGDAEISTLVYDAAKFAEHGDALAKATPSLRHVATLGASAYVDLCALADQYSAIPVKPEATPDATLAIAYTGGTTGRPKGAILSQRCIVSSMELVCTHWDWPEEVRILLSTPISHAAGAMIVPTLLKGGTVHLLEGFSAKETLVEIERHQITTLFLIPTMIYMLLDELERAAGDVSSVRTIFYGAAPMSPTRLKEALTRFGPVFMQLYGQVEASVAITALKRVDHLNPDLLLSCGRPLTPDDFALFDADMNRVTQGEVGEICIKGSAMMDGYWRREGETAAAFRGGWLHTGDLARQDENGFVYIVDRAKDMIVSGGFNVYPREIEDVLSAHPAVQLAAIIGVPHDKWGEAVHGLVVTRPDALVSERELIDLIKEKKGAVYAPKSIEFVESLPLTALGKIDKKAVRARHWSDRERLVN